MFIHSWSGPSALTQLVTPQEFLKAGVKGKTSLPLFHPLVRVFFLVAGLNLRGIPSRTDLVGRLKVWDLLLVAVVLKLSLLGLGLVLKKTHRRIHALFF